MVIGGDGLMPTPPRGPTQAVAGRLPPGQDQPPPQTPHLGDAPGETRPRLAWNAVRGLAG